MIEPDSQYEVDKTSAVPIYVQLASWIEAKITTGEWPPNFRLPGEIELAHQFGVARGSLRKAISLLISRNLLVQIHGRGTFVAPFVFDQTWAGRLTGVSEELMMMGIPFQTEVLEQDIRPVPLKEGQLLDLAPGTPIVYLKRLRSVEGSPVVLHESFFPAAKFNDLLNVDFTKESLILTLEQMYGIHLSWAAHTFAVIRAGALVAKNLQINVGMPLLYNEHIMYDSNDQKVQVSIGWFRSDRFRIKTISRRGTNEPFYSALGTSANLNASDQKKTEAAFSEKTTSEFGKLPGLTDLLTPDRIGLNIKANNCETAIRIVGQMMVESGVVEERYVDAMVQTAKQLGPYIVIAPGVAMPHALPEDGVLKPCLAFATLNPPVEFGNSANDPVQVILAIGAVDAIQHVEALREFADVLANPENIVRLIAAKTYNDVLSILSRN